MYYVVNKTSNNLVIGDIKFELGPKKAIDLEQIRKRSEIDDSSDLKLAIKSGLVDVRRDSKRKKVEKTIEVQHTVERQEVEVDVDSIREAVKDEIKQQLKSLPAGDSGGAELKDLMKDLQSLLISSKGQQSSSPGLPQVDDGFELDDETLANVHAKHIKRATEGTVAKVDYEEKDISTSISKNVDELDNLLG
jgi:hypothetical protein